MWDGAQTREPYPAQPGNHHQPRDRVLKLVHTFALVLVIAAVGGFTLAVQDGPGPVDRPLVSAAAPVRGFVFVRPSPDMARLDAQMTILRQMYDKAMAARTPAERDVLMATGMHAIHNAMKVMNETSSGGMRDSEGDGTAYWRMMEKRLEMTQIALHLATDRPAVAPPK